MRFDRDHVGDSAVRPRVEHALREVWQRECYHRFLRKDRHEAIEAREEGIEYSEVVLQRCFDKATLSNEESSLGLHIPLQPMRRPLATKADAWRFSSTLALSAGAAGCSRVAPPCLDFGTCRFLS